MDLETHPTVQWYKQQSAQSHPYTAAEAIDPEWIRQICLKQGAADVGFVEIDRAALADQRHGILRAFPATKTVVGMVFPLNRTAIRSLEHSLANLEFHLGYATSNEACRKIVAELQSAGIPALNSSMGFPYNADKWPDTMWFVADKIVAVEAGIGKMGLNRIVLHPKLGGCVMLGTLLLGAEMSSYSAPLDYNPCVDCKLCAGVCPTGAISADGHFDFPSCYSHNYREKVAGFQAWVENVVKSKNVKDYRSRVRDNETLSMWQNLSICAQTRCDRCMAVCPAGEDAIGEFLGDRKGFVESTVKPFKELPETIYVVPGSDAEAHVVGKNSVKTPRRISNGIKPGSVAGFLRALPLAFQRGQSKGLEATYHFTFTGNEQTEATAVIRNQTIEVKTGLVGDADLHVTADANTWVSFLAKETNLVWALITRRIRLKGSPSLMKAFAKCFPS